MASRPDNSGTLDVAVHGAIRDTDLSIGTGVEVRNSFCATWSGGFEVVAATSEGYVLRRLSDRYILPVEFVADEVRQAF